VRETERENSQKNKNVSEQERDNSRKNKNVFDQERSEGKLSEVQGKQDKVNLNCRRRIAGEGENEFNIGRESRSLE
jgi:hypothetical protein